MTEKERLNEISSQFYLKLRKLDLDAIENLNEESMQSLENILQQLSQILKYKQLAKFKVYSVAKGSIFRKEERIKNLLISLKEYPEGITIRQISKILNIGRETITKYIKELIIEEKVVQCGDIINIYGCPAKLYKINNEIL